MRCVHPRVVYDGNFASEYPCGKCAACRRDRTREWANRIVHELSEWSDTCFLTLTYDDEHLPSTGSLYKRDLQLFFKRLRKGLEKKVKVPCANKKGYVLKTINQPLKYFACGEYGERYGRPHYHAIIFGLSSKSDCFIKLPSRKGGKQYFALDEWPYGQIDVGDVTYKSAAYVAGYIQKKLGVSAYPGREPPFQLQSQGIGLRYVKKNEERLVRDLSFTVNGARCSLPRYYRKKLGSAIQQDDLNRLSEERVERLDEFCAATNRETVDARSKYEVELRRQHEDELKALDAIKNDRKF